MGTKKPSINLYRIINYFTEYWNEEPQGQWNEEKKVKEERNVNRKMLCAGWKNIYDNVL